MQTPKLISFKVYTLSGSCNAIQCAIVDYNVLILIFVSGMIFSIWLIRQIPVFEKVWKWVNGNK